MGCVRTNASTCALLWPRKLFIETSSHLTANWFQSANISMWFLLGSFREAWRRSAIVVIVHSIQWLLGDRMNTLVCNQCENMHVHLSVAETLKQPLQVRLLLLFTDSSFHCRDTMYLAYVPSAEFRFLTWSGNGCGCCSRCGCGSCETCGSWSGTWENTVTITNEV